MDIEVAVRRAEKLGYIAELPNSHDIYTLTPAGRVLMERERLTDFPDDLLERVCPAEQLRLSIFEAVALDQRRTHDCTFNQS